ncbi:hypothetical protein WJX75_008452 [Coccomyxa subellipsoidea]|uniref:Lipoyl-binding domain-containing protein n=1 Tax=Coccomyxa subellipsoidea TaxID=248742 RepID=A0ABR2YJU1_9CHLO
MPGIRRQLLAACRSEEGVVSPFVTTFDASAEHRWDCNECKRIFNQIRGFRLSTYLASTVDVEVGSFGESITEGSIATISKQAGDTVAEDEVLFQIETDKVTIDVRAPQSGNLESVLVKEEDTVTVGQVVAKITVGSAEAGDAGKAAGKDDSATGPSSIESEALEKESPISAGKAAEAAKEASDVSGEIGADSSGDVSADSSAESEPLPHRQPRIKFPTRRTPDGIAISSLPIEEQKKYLEAPEAAAAPPPDPSAKQPQAASFSTGPWYAGRERGTKLSQSRVLTEREMEMIELGGA